MPFASSRKLSSAERERYARGRASFELGDADVTLAYLSPLLERREDFADLHYMVGVMLDRRGDCEEAAQHLRDAIRLNPGYTEALIALGSVYEREGNYERSRDLAERAAYTTGSGRLDTTTLGKLANLQAAVGDAYAAVGDLSDAIHAYRKALDRCPEFHDIRCRLGRALGTAGLPHQAEIEFKRVLRGNPELLEARVQLGLTYYTLGRTPEAVALWQDTLLRDASRQDAKMYLRMVDPDPGDLDRPAGGASDTTDLDEIDRG